MVLIRQKLQSHKSMQSHVLRLVNHTHPAAAELLDDAVMRNGLTDHGSGQCYGGSVGQSMKVVELVVSQEGSWRKSPLQCAGINRQEAENAKFSRVRSSDPLGPEFCAGY